LDNELILSHKFSEQRETFKRVANIKAGGVDHSEPTTFKLKAKLSENKKSKASLFQHGEHLKNLASLHRRMNYVGTK
jgi:hypothetical protein